MESLKTLNEKKDNLNTQLEEVNNRIAITGVIKKVVELRDISDQLNSMFQSPAMGELVDETDTLFQIMNRVDKESIRLMDVHSLDEDDIINCPDL